MTALFSIDCHACGAKNTIDAEMMRRVERVFNDDDLATVESAIVSRSAAESVRRITEFRCNGPELLPSLTDDPEPAA